MNATLNTVEREPLTRGSRALLGKLCLASTRNYHSMIRDDTHRWYLCGCMKDIRGVRTSQGPLHRNRRKDKKWAERW